MDYKWIQDVYDYVGSYVIGRFNNHETRSTVLKHVIKILKESGVDAFVDCGHNVNTPDVIDHGEFRLFVKTPHIEFMFKIFKEKDSK